MSISTNLISGIISEYFTADAIDAAFAKPKIKQHFDQILNPQTEQPKTTGIRKERPKTLKTPRARNKNDAINQLAAHMSEKMRFSASGDQSTPLIDEETQLLCQINNLSPTAQATAKELAMEKQKNSSIASDLSSLISKKAKQNFKKQGLQKAFDSSSDDEA
jgi:hypothetical protein